MDLPELERLRLESLKPQVRDLWAAGFVAGLDPSKEDDLAIYQKDPVGFANDILGVSLTPAQMELLEAVRDYEIVQVKSATGVGKTFVLGVLAVWVYKCFDWAQVYTAAAPPPQAVSASEYITSKILGQLGCDASKNTPPCPSNGCGRCSCSSRIGESLCCNIHKECTTKTAGEYVNFYRLKRVCFPYLNV